MKTYYTPESLKEGLEKIKELKNIMVKSQDYENSFKLLELEKYFIDKIEKDKNRKI